MTRTQMVELIKQRMGNNQDDALTTLIENELQWQHRALEEEPEQPWFLLGTVTQVDITDEFPNFAMSGEDGLLMPHSQVTLLTRKSSAASTDKWYPLEKDDFAFLLEANGVDTTSSEPTHYATKSYNTTGVVYQVFPAPEQNMDYQLVGFFGAVDLDADAIENSWSKHAPEVLINRTGRIIAGQYTSLNEFAAIFAAGESTAVQSLKRKTIALEEEQILYFKEGKN